MGSYKSNIFRMIWKGEKTLEGEWRSWELKIVKFGIKGSGEDDMIRQQEIDD